MWRNVILGFSISVVALCALGCGAASGSVEPIQVVNTPEGEVSFAQTVLPIFVDHCKRCHGEDRKGGLYLLDYDGVMKGGNRRDFVIPGDPANSRVITSVKKTKEPFMPPRVFKPLTEDRIAAIAKWIEEGAKNN